MHHGIKSKPSLHFSASVMNRISLQLISSFSAHVRGWVPETDLVWGAGEGGRAPPFLAITCFFAITLKNYKLSLLKLN